MYTIMAEETNKYVHRKKETRKYKQQLLFLHLFFGKSESKSFFSEINHVNRPFSLDNSFRTVHLCTVHFFVLHHLWRFIPSSKPFLHSSDNPLSSNSLLYNVSNMTCIWSSALIFGSGSILLFKYKNLLGCIISLLVCKLCTFVDRKSSFFHLTMNALFLLLLTSFKLSELRCAT